MSVFVFHRFHASQLSVSSFIYVASSMDGSSTLLFSIRIVPSPFYRWEFKENHEEWLTTVKPDLAPALAARVKAALETNSHSVPLVQRIKDEARYAINDLLKVM